MPAFPSIVSKFRSNDRSRDNDLKIRPTPRTADSRWFPPIFPVWRRSTSTIFVPASSNSRKLISSIPNPWNPNPSDPNLWILNLHGLNSQAPNSPGLNSKISNSSDLNPLSLPGLNPSGSIPLMRVRRNEEVQMRTGDSMR